MPVTLRRFTVDDLASFPDDGTRYELLDGVFFVTPAPLPPHEELVARLFGRLVEHLRRWPGVRIAPRSEVLLRPHNKLEPDIQVYRADLLPPTWDEVEDRWLAVEVGSRSTRMYDREYKRDAYLQMGVREVWLVDRFEREVRVANRERPETAYLDAFTWSPPAPVPPLRVDVASLFEGIPAF